MNTVVQKKVEELFAVGSKIAFKGHRLPGADFSGRDLKSYDFRGASIPGGLFVETDCTYTNFEGVNLHGANFDKAICRHTNFKEANLASAQMTVKDFFGATVTLDCRSFEGVKVLPGYWYGWLFFALLMEAPTQEAKEGLLTFLGPERYRVLRESYARRGV